MSTQDQAYHALSIAAERMGLNNFRAGVGVIRRGRKIIGFAPTPEHRAIVDAMPKVLDGRMSPDEGMALLHDYDVVRQRIG